MTRDDLVIKFNSFLSIDPNELRSKYQKLAEMKLEKTRLNMDKLNLKCSTFELGESVYAKVILSREDIKIANAKKTEISATIEKIGCDKYGFITNHYDVRDTKDFKTYSNIPIKDIKKRLSFC